MSQLQLPKQFVGIPPIVQQLIETVANDSSWQTSKFNAKQTLITTRDCINWALDRYNNEESAKPKKRK